MTDERVRPQIPTSTVFGSVVMMLLAQMGSLNALEQERGNSFWRRWLEVELPSADTLGRVFSQVILADIRRALHCVYSRLKRNKALRRAHGFSVLIVDGHESSASYLRCCSGCLERVIHTEEGDRIQYYHRSVLAMLSLEQFPFLLDLEPQRKGEDEVSCALRLLKRVLEDYPRGFDLVVADGLYCRAPFFGLLRKHGKEVIAVLKDERRELLQDARGLFRSEAPLVEAEDNITRKMWDIEDFTSWQTLGTPVRVVCSLETRTVRRQRTGTEESETSQWVWATTLSKDNASTRTIVKLGHDRWLIENKAIREMVTYWHADHVYKHHPQAITAFWLTLMLVLNLFRAFIYLNIKPCLRAKHSHLYFSRLLSSGLYDEIPQPIPP